jgi:DNA gyrase subunit A
VIRTAAREIASQGRDATGVRVMNLEDGQTVAAVTRVAAEEEVEDG